MLRLQSNILDDTSLILGLRDKAIPKTENDAEGRAFPEEIEKYMVSIYTYVRNNLYYIETLIHQFAICGGITEGIYRAKDEFSLWEKVS